MKNENQREEDFFAAPETEDVLKGAFAGLIGGLAAAFVMREFQRLWNKASKSLKDDSEKNQQSGGEKKEPATVKAAEMLSEKIFDHNLTKSEKSYAGPAMHYWMGGTSGLIYGVSSEFMPLTKIGAGLPFGAMVWLISDDLALPALGLSKSPFNYPLSTHAYALASHLVYGAVTQLISDQVREALD